MFDWSLTAVVKSPGLKVFGQPVHLLPSPGLTHKTTAVALIVYKIGYGRLSWVVCLSDNFWAPSKALVL